MIKPRSKITTFLMYCISPAMAYLYLGRPIRVFNFWAIIIIISYSAILFIGLETFFKLKIFLGLALLTWLIFLIDTFVIAQSSKEYQLKWYNRWYWYIIWPTLLSIPISLWQFSSGGLRKYYQPFKIPGTSMSRTLRSGDHVIVDKQYYSKHAPARGDIAVFWRDDDPSTKQDESKIFIIKRIIALPGETVSLKERKVLIDGKPLNEPYALWLEGGREDGEFAAQTVPANTLFFLGDNRDQSRDSRYYPNPFIPIDHLIGKALYIYWAWDKNSKLGSEL